MSLHETPVTLGFNLWEFHLLWRNPQVYPRRHFSYRQIWIRLEQQLGNELLHPSCPSLGVRRNDDVVIAKLQLVPDRRIKVMVVYLTRLDRPLNVF